MSDDDEELQGFGVLLPLKQQQPPAKAASHAASNHTKDRFTTLNDFWDFSARRLERSEIAVWMLLYRDTQPNGVARASYADLAKRGGMDPRTVGRAIERLERLGLLEVVRQGGLRRGCSAYRVHALLPQSVADIHVRTP